VKAQRSAKQGFKIIKGGDKPLDIIACPKCGGVAFIEIRHTIHRIKNGISAGIKAKACLMCAINGEMTVI
jgi:hypothetical protein